MTHKLFRYLLACVFLVNVGVSNAETKLGCIIEPERTAELGSQVIGLVESVKVERGDHVRKGQVLATLRSDIERASMNVAKTRSTLEADVKSSAANLRLAQLNEKRSAILVEKNFLSKQTLDKSQAETQIAKERLNLAMEQLEIANSELGLAKAQLDIRVIRAPFDGIVADRFIWPGERVEEKPLFRIVKTNPLRVELVAPASLYGSIKKDTSVTVTPDLANSAPIEAKITLVDSLIDGASNTFRVRAEIQNADFTIPSGLRCKVALQDTAVNESTPSDNNPSTKPAKPLISPAAAPSVNKSLPIKKQSVADVQKSKVPAQAKVILISDKAQDNPLTQLQSQTASPTLSLSRSLNLQSTNEQMLPKATQFKKPAAPNGSGTYY